MKKPTEKQTIPLSHHRDGVGISEGWDEGGQSRKANQHTMYQDQMQTQPASAGTTGSKRETDRQRP
jgi:hypothetical protein